MSAGASGAIFGMAGVLVAFLYYGKHDLTAEERRAELRSTRNLKRNLCLGEGSLRAHNPLRNCRLRNQKRARMAVYLVATSSQYDIQR